MEFIKDYPSATLAILFIMVGLIYSLIRDLIYTGKNRSGNGKEPPVAKIFKKTLDDISSLLAFGITATIIIMALAKATIPPLIENAFYMVVGYYFGKVQTDKTNGDNKEIPKTNESDKSKVGDLPVTHQGTEKIE